jgi:hypothetical protein
LKMVGGGCLSAHPKFGTSLCRCYHTRILSYFVRSSAHRELSYEVRNSIFCYLVHSPETPLLCRTHLNTSVAQNLALVERDAPCCCSCSDDTGTGFIPITNRFRRSLYDVRGSEHASQQRPCARPKPSKKEIRISVTAL